MRGVLKEICVVIHIVLPLLVYAFRKEQYVMRNMQQKEKKIPLTPPSAIEKLNARISLYIGSRLNWKANIEAVYKRVMSRLWGL